MSKKEMKFFEVGVTEKVALIGMFCCEQHAEELLDQADYYGFLEPKKANVYNNAKSMILTTSVDITKRRYILNLYAEQDCPIEELELVHPNLFNVEQYVLQGSFDKETFISYGNKMFEVLTTFDTEKEADIYCLKTNTVNFGKVPKLAGARWVVVKRNPLQQTYSEK